MFSGRILKRCSACNKPLHQRLPGLKLNALSMVIWVLLANWMTKGIEGRPMFATAYGDVCSIAREALRGAAEPKPLPTESAKISDRGTP